LAIAKNDSFSQMFNANSAGFGVNHTDGTLWPNFPRRGESGKSPKGIAGLRQASTQVEQRLYLVYGCLLARLPLEKGHEQEIISTYKLVVRRG
jgi:hypothetical protein